MQMTVKSKNKKKPKRLLIKMNKYLRAIKKQRIFQYV